MKIDDWFQTLLLLPLVLAPIPAAGLLKGALGDYRIPAMS